MAKERNISETLALLDEIIEGYKSLHRLWDKIESERDILEAVKEAA